MCLVYGTPLNCTIPWCGGCRRWDSNPEGLAPRDLSDLHVSRFRHAGTTCSVDEPRQPCGQERETSSPPNRGPTVAPTRTALVTVSTQRGAEASGSVHGRKRLSPPRGVRRPLAQARAIPLSHLRGTRSRSLRGSTSAHGGSGSDPTRDHGPPRRARRSARRGGGPPSRLTLA